MLKNINILKNVKGDLSLWVVIFLMSLASLLIIYSATGRLAYEYKDGNVVFYLVRHLMFIAGGFTIMYIFTNVISIKLLSRFSKLFMLGTIGLLIVTLVQQKMTGAATNRAFDLGFIKFQPAEIVKIALVLFAAKIFATAREGKTVTKNGFWTVAGVMSFVCLIIAYGDTSTAVIIGASIVCLMFVAGVPWKSFLIFSGAILLIAVTVYFTAPYLPSGLGRVQTVKARIDDFVYGDQDLEIGTTQAKYGELAIYEGGTFGKGVGRSEVSNYMEAAYNDFVFAILIEEYGLVGGMFVLVGYLFILYRGGQIARNAKRSFPAFVVLGLTMVYTFQAFVNMGVSAGVIPVTGQPLPWISMGGTSLLFTAAGFGIILSVSYQSNRKVKEEPKVVYESNEPEQDEEIKE